MVTKIKVSQKKLDKIKVIAKEIRKQVVNQNKKNCMFDLDLCGLCAIASVRLFDALKKHKFSPVLVRGDGHCYIECLGYIVDITATQFGRKPICVLPVAKANIYEGWHLKDVISRSKTKRSWKRLFSDWDDEQHPIVSNFWVKQKPEEY